MSNLFLHCGSYRVTLDELRAVPYPESTRTHKIIPHADLYDRVLTSAHAGFNLEVRTSEHAVSANGNKYFAMMEMEGTHEFSTLIGLRSSYDRTVAVTLAAGSCVFVCDNLCFSGDVKVGRRHTRYMMDDLDNLIAQALTEVVGATLNFDTVFNSFKAQEIDADVVDYLCMEGFRQKVYSSSRIGKIHDEYLSPTFPAFDEHYGNMWGLFNAGTHVLKPRQNTQDVFGVTETTAKWLEVCKQGMNGSDVDIIDVEVISEG